MFERCTRCLHTHTHTHRYTHEDDRKTKSMPATKHFSVKDSLISGSTFSELCADTTSVTRSCCIFINGKKTSVSNYCCGIVLSGVSLNCITGHDNMKSLHIYLIHVMLYKNMSYYIVGILHILHFIMSCNSHHLQREVYLVIAKCELGLRVLQPIQIPCGIQKNTKHMQRCPATDKKFTLQQRLWVRKVYTM